MRPLTIEENCEGREKPKQMRPISGKKGKKDEGRVKLQIVEVHKKKRKPLILKWKRD